MENFIFCAVSVVGSSDNVLLQEIITEVGFIIRCFHDRCKNYCCYKICFVEYIINMVKNNTKFFISLVFHEAKGTDYQKQYWYRFVVMGT